MVGNLGSVENSYSANMWFCALFSAKNSRPEAALPRRLVEARRLSCRVITAMIFSIGSLMSRVCLRIMSSVLRIRRRRVLDDDDNDDEWVIRCLSGAV